jgi:hypothetical protein
MSNLIRDETEEEPSGSSTLVAQGEGFIYVKKVFSRAKILAIKGEK